MSSHFRRGGGVRRHPGMIELPAVLPLASSPLWTMGDSFFDDVFHPRYYTPFGGLRRHWRDLIEDDDDEFMFPSSTSLFPSSRYRPRRAVAAPTSSMLGRPAQWLLFENYPPADTGSGEEEEEGEAEEQQPTEEDEFFADLEVPRFFALAAPRVQRKPRRSVSKKEKEKIAGEKKAAVADAEKKEAAVTKPEDRKAAAHATADEAETKEEPTAKKGEKSPAASSSASAAAAASPAPVFSRTYTYSSSTYTDENGVPISKKVKHYEDSSGRAKTWKCRAIGDEMYPEETQKWPGKEEQEEKRTTTAMTEREKIEEFEKKWRATLFGRVAERAGDAAALKQPVEAKKIKGGEEEKKKRLEGEEDKPSKLPVAAGGGGTGEQRHPAKAAPNNTLDSASKLPAAQAPQPTSAAAAS